MTTREFTLWINGFGVGVCATFTLVSWTLGHVETALLNMFGLALNLLMMGLNIRQNKEQDKPNQ